MLIYILRTYNLFIKPIKQSLFIKNHIFSVTNKQSFAIINSQISICQIRSVSFFSKYPAKLLWKSVLSVSNAGKNRGRGKGKKFLTRNLNINQKIGTGKVNMMWPGLNTPVMRDVNILKPKNLSDNIDLQPNNTKKREDQFRQSKRQHPLLRGWTSAKFGGRTISIPNHNKEVFKNFNTKIIEHKYVGHMTGKLGRKRQHSSFVITGNQTGLCGFALGKASDLMSALRIAMNKAINKVIFVPIYNNHTVYHDFFTQFGSTKIFISKKPKGYGLVCHRAIMCACNVIGIKDLYAKVEGSINYQNIIKAFILGLLRQKTFQQLAEEKQLHLVEFRKENLMYPKLIASPITARKSEVVPSTEVLDFTQHILKGKIVLQKKKYLPFYTNYTSYKNKQRKMEYLRNQNHIRIQICAKHGELKSFLTNKFSEAKPYHWKKIGKTGEEENVFDIKN